MCCKSGTPTSESVGRKNINIRVRNKKTGDIYEQPIGDFYNEQKSERDLQESDREIESTTQPLKMLLQNAQPSDTVERKFTDSISLDEWEIETDTGWEPLSAIHKTIPYSVWRIETFDGHWLECADNHIVILNDRFTMFCPRPHSKSVVDYNYFWTIFSF